MSDHQFKIGDKVRFGSGATEYTVIAVDGTALGLKGRAGRFWDEAWGFELVAQPVEWFANDYGTHRGAWHPTREQANQCTEDFGSPGVGVIVKTMLDGKVIDCRYEAVES